MNDHGEWQVEDRVFAPWEPIWLYPATILCIDDDVVFLRFDDGDRALLPIERLESIAIRVNDVVHCRRDREEQLYFPAKVLGLSDDGLRVRYQDNNETDLVPISFIRIQTQPINNPFLDD